MNDSEDTTLPEVYADSGLASAPSAGGDVPMEYAALQGVAIQAEKFEIVSPCEALLREDDVSSSINHRFGGGSRSKMRILAYALAFGLVTFLFLTLPWDILSLERPIPQRLRADPSEYVGETPVGFKKQIAAINDDIRHGRWLAAENGLDGLRAQAFTDGVPMPEEMKQWLLSELLVIGARTGSGKTDEAREIMEQWRAAHDVIPPFRMLNAFAVQLASAGDSPDDLLETLSLLRGNYGREMDGEPPLLEIEAQAHIARMPEEYREGDRVLDESWRRANHAIVKYREATRDDNPILAELERRRWRKLLDYFGLSGYLQANTPWVSEPRLSIDGVSYTYSDVENREKTFAKK